MDEEFQTERVPDAATIAWWRIALMNVVFSLSLPTFLGGLELVKAAPANTFLLGTLAGGLFLTLIAAAMAVIGAQTRLSSYMLARIAFGKRASIVLNLAFALSLLGWFGINIELFGVAMQRLLQDSMGMAVPLWVLEACGGILMTLLSFLGLRAINRLSLLVTPLMALATVLMVGKILGADSLSAVLAAGQTSGLSFGQVLSATVGAVAVGAVIMPDTCRFVQTRRGGIGVAIATYLVSAPLVALAAGLAGLATGETDLLALMLALGLGIGAFVIVFGGTTTLNSLNLYSAALGMKAALPQLHRVTIVVAGGIGGTLFAFANILDSFIPFLIYLTVIFIPVGAIVICDFFVLRRPAYAAADLRQGTDWRPAAILAWAAGSGAAFATMNQTIHITGTTAFDALLITVPVYLALDRAFDRKERKVAS